MILSVSELDSEYVPDVCIIGSGPAGISLALTLHAAGKDVLVLEGGADALTGESQDLYRGEVRGDYSDPTESRLRFFGGSSNHWSGRCRPLDAVDFDGIEGVAETGWPITKANLDPYDARAREILELGTAVADTPHSGAFQQVAFDFSDPPVQFRGKYTDRFAEAEALSVCFNANLTDLETEAGRVTAAQFSDYDGTTVRLRARVFVLACGGIENSRLLLHFNARSDGRLIPEAGTLGRYFFDHPGLVVGEALLDTPQEERIWLALDAQALRAQGLRNCSLSLVPAPESESRLRAAAQDLACLAPRVGPWLWERMGRSLNCGARIYVTCDQLPQPDNRITLSETMRDSFGIPAPVIHIRPAPEDLRNVREIALLYGAEIARRDQGRLRLIPELAEPPDAVPDSWNTGTSHHMGGTRMSARAGDGIVDADLRVWGQDNLYVAGSSVFPSGGHANPTFTIVQLSLRLADHLATQL